MVTPWSVPQTKVDVNVLENLFGTHDAVFLLTETRDTRWFSMVLGPVMA